jgi:hypothetical protein
MKRILAEGSNDPAVALVIGALRTFGSGMGIFLNDSCPLIP